ncbi:rapamycin-insensitive companion of mTOR [Nasonia vitripennis]|uniref:Rapamycin-insensitive companion of mTOR n=1 Tax=Nasonia vitripennis TaxID=7425 RepID=A0A7M7IU65_NASVI|nr:rapamycin-insensitive companion of mTOR [Nasonia vitripennis]
MAISSWMIWNRSLRSNTPHRRHRHDQEENCVEFDLSKDFKENITEALSNLCQRHGVSDAKKLAYLNAIVKLVTETEVPEYGYSADELYCCLRVGLVHQATQVRAAALRAIRYMLKKEQDVVAINRLQYPYFIARSMDINIRNEMERIQALRLLRRILVLAPKHFSPTLARSLISITRGGMEEKDRAFRVFLAVLCELGVLNSNVLISCGGVGTLARAATSGQSPAITEAVVGVLLRLLCNPETRTSVSLLCLAAPYCELESVGLERSNEDWDQRFAASKHALLSVLRSYSGVIHFCHPNENSGLKAISDILYVEQLEVRGAVLELLYELLGLPLPTWTDEPDVALAAVDPSRFQNSWKLSEGFVAAEGRTILPSLSSHCPNITELHLGLLVYILLECGLHRALAETIVSSDTFISVRAAVLLGALLHLAHSLLPPEVCDMTPPLPNLLEQASVGRHQALAAVAILGRMHSLMRRKPAPASLFMDRLLQAGAWLRPTMPHNLRRQSSIRNWLRRESPMQQLLKDSQVLTNKDALAWNWAAVRSILRSQDNAFSLLHDSDHRMFIKKLVKYFKPSSNQYSRIELSTNALMARETTLAGCELINLLLDIHEPDGTRFLNELIADIADQMTSIRLAQSAHDCLFSPRHVSTTCCQKYFLFIGQLSHSLRGIATLRTFNLLEKLQDLAVTTKHDCYVKLIISSLDYMRDGPNRQVMTKVIQNSTLESTRMYATQFLRIILRAKMVDAHQWAIGLLLNKLSDSSRVVALAALEALHEACEEPEYLEVVLQKSEDKWSSNWDQWLHNLGDKGHLLKIRLYSLRSSFGNLPSAAEELERWIKPSGLAERYAGLVEGEIHDSLTRRQRGENGCYIRRSNGNPVMPKDVFVPPHMIGQLVQHDHGMQLLLRRNVLQRFARIVQRFRMECVSNGSGGQSREDRAAKEDGKVDEKKNDAEGGISRLETILDSEIADKADMHTPLKCEPMVEVRRKLSQDDSRRTTPERSWRGELDMREEYACGLEGRILKVKSALWALGHVGTSALGVEQLTNLGIIELLTSMAESSPHYSVRATAMYALSLVSTSRAGADILTCYNWPCVRYKRGAYWPVVQPSSTSSSMSGSSQQQSASPVSVQRHHRSLSDGKPELPPEPVLRRQRNRSESAATDIEPRRYMLPERGETPSPLSSAQRLSQQDAEGYAKLRSLQRHRRPSYSHSSLEMYSLDGRLSLQSLSELESSRSWIAEIAATPTQQPTVTTPEESSSDSNPRYMGISLPRKLHAIFPEATPSEILRDKVNKSRPVFESKRTQNTSESSILQEDTRMIARLLRPEREQQRMQEQMYESDSDRFSPIPTIILDDRAKANVDVIASNKLSINESDSECVLATVNNRLVLPEDSKPKQRTMSTSRQNPSDMDEESSSEYEATSDHSRICLVCFREKSVSNDSVGTDVDFRRTVDKTRRDILRHTQRLANPVFSRHSQQTLLRLRQQYPNIFQDVCIYSEVASRLANNTYRITARRFLQELFLDSSFDTLYEEPTTILKMTVNAPEDSQSSHVPKTHAAVVVSPSHKQSKPSEAKVNGRLALPTDPQPEHLSVVTEETAATMAAESPSVEFIVNSQKSSTGGDKRLLAEQRRSDEKIIAEILKPEERMRISKSSDKMLKATGINTAISLE